MRELKQSFPDVEGIFRASKWLKHLVLIDGAEMRSLFDHLGEFSIFNVSAPTSLQKAEIQREDFLEKYQQYVEQLKSGKHPDESSLRPYFSSALTASPELLYAMKISEEKVLVKPIRPIVQLQLHHFFVSGVDGKFHSMVHSSESITWGIQFSYPQLFQHPHSEEIIKVTQSADYPNTSLFAMLAKWMRNHTVATPFIFEGKRTNAPMRLGKNCFSWINQHPGLQAKNIQVKGIHESRTDHP